MYLRQVVRLTAILLGITVSWPNFSAANEIDDCGMSVDASSIALCTRAINSGRYRGKDLATLYYARGANYRDYKQDYDRAIADYTKAIQIHPRFEYFSIRGQAYFVKRNFDRAIADFSEAIRILPKADSYAMNNLLSERAQAYDGKGDYDRAIIDHNEAIRLIPLKTTAEYIKPILAEALKHRGNTYLSKREKDRAIADYKESAENTTQKEEPVTVTSLLVEGLNYRGNNNLSKGKQELAIADYKEAVQTDPKDVLAYINLGDIYLLTDKYPEAIAYYNKADEIQPKNAWTHFGRGQAKLKNGDVKGGKADIAAGKAIIPNIAEIASQKLNVK